MFTMRTKTQPIASVMVIGLTLTSIVLASSGASASDGVRNLLHNVEFTVGPSAWYSAGEAGFKGDDEGWRWTLEYPLDGWMAEIHAESSFPFAVGQRRFGISVRARHARSIRVDGTSNDTDRDSLGITSDYSESDCEADIIMWDLEAAFFVRVHQRRVPLTLDIGVVAGYGTQRFKFTDRNLHTMIWDHQETDQRDTGVVSYYTTTFHTGRAGLFLDMHTHRRLRCYIEAAYVPYLRAKADALWVLRNYPFWQKADGTGYTLSLRANCKVWRSLSLFTGLRRVSLIADRHAVEGGILDGTPYEDEPYVSEITSRYSGVEIGGALRF